MHSPYCRHFPVVYSVTLRRKTFEELVLERKYINQKSYIIWKVDIPQTIIGPTIGAIYQYFKFDASPVLLSLTFQLGDLLTLLVV